MAERRYDLDWLRIIAFGLLILYHIGMVYVEHWGYHYKSSYQSSWLANIMLMVNPWRMALLWMISGIASAYLLRKTGWWRFFLSRSHRLLLPLLFGVWVIVPPQLFVEMSANGDFSGSYLSFYMEFLNLNSAAFAGYTSGIWPHVDVNHLWYLRELWLFTVLMMLLLPILLWIRNRQWLAKVATTGRGVGLLLVIPALLTAIEVLAFPDVGSEGRRMAMGFAFLILGFLIALEEGYFALCARLRHIAAGGALASYATYLTVYHWVWIPSGGELDSVWGLRVVALDHLDRWLWLCAGFGYAYQYLNRPHQWLPYLSAGVFPYYIIHQTLIVVGAFVLGKLAIGPIAEPLAVIVITILGSIFFYELGRRAGRFAPLFGLKWESSQRARISTQVTRGAGVAAVMIIAAAVIW